jgi:hypothetical protein
MLIEGSHWRHFPSDSDTLCVFYAPVEVPSPKLPYFKSTADLPVGRLLVNPGTDEFYQDCADDVQEIVARVSSSYRRTIHYGYSQGATGALDIGLADSKCSAIFALSPHLVLDRPHSRSARLMSEGVMARQRADRIGRIRKTNKDVYLFISCMDPEDGIQVRDARALADSRAEVFYLNESHFLPSVNKPDATIRDYIVSGEYTLPEGAKIASERAQEDAALVYDLMAAFKDNANIEPERIQAYSSINSHAAAFWLGHYLTRRGDFSHAAVHFLRSIILGKETNQPVHDSMLCAANIFAATGMPEMALGHYRQARSLAPKSSTICFCEARLLAQLNRKTDLLELLGACIVAGCDAETLQKIRSLVP